MNNALKVGGIAMRDCRPRHLRFLFLIGLFITCGTAAQAQKKDFSKADSLNQVVLQLTTAGKYDEGFALGTKAVAAAKQSVGEQHPAYATALFNLAELNAAKGKFADSELLHKQALAIRKQTLGEQHADYGNSLINLAQIYAATGRHALAEPLYKPALAILKQALGERDPAYATALNYQAEFYTVVGRYAEAEPLFREVVAIRKQVVGEDHLDYAMALVALALHHLRVGQYPAAEPLLKQALVTLKKTVGDQHIMYGNASNNLGFLYKTTGRYAEAETLYAAARAIYKKAYGEQHAAYAIALNNKGELCVLLGRYAEAEPAYKASMAVLKKVYGDKHHNYGMPLNNLAYLYNEMGRYAEAEPLYVATVALYKQALGEKHPSYATALDNLAILYEAMGRYAQAEPLLKESLAVQKKAMGEQHPNYGTALHNLGSFYKMTGRYAEAEPLLLASQANKKKLLGEKHIEYVTSLINQAQFYALTKRYAEAEPILNQVLATLKQTVGEQHPAYGVSLNSLAMLYQSTNRDAVPIFDQALAIQKKTIGENHANYARCLNNLALTQQAKGRYAEAQAANAEATAVWTRNLRSTFAGLSEREKQQFSTSLTASTEIGHNLLARQLRAGTTPAGTANAYDNLLFTKGLLLATTAGMQQRLLASGDTALVGGLGRWQSAKRRLAAARALPLAQQRDRGLDPARLEEQANVLEKSLAAKSAAFRQGASLPSTTWQQVQKALRKGEAALELVRYHAGRQSVTDSVYYSAYLITPTSKAPQLVVMRNGSDLEARYLPAYRRLTHTPSGGEGRGVIEVNAGGDAALANAKLLYTAFWQPIAQALPPGTKTVYLSADGAYQQLNLATLQNPATDKFLLDELDLRLVGSTRKLVESAAPGAAKASKADEGVLVGAPAYRLATLPDTKSLDTPGPLLASTRSAYSRSERWLTDGEVPLLPGTAKEIEELDALFATAKRPHRCFTGAAATEDQGRDLHHPRVLHIATHGFFLPAVEATGSAASATSAQESNYAAVADPMLRSGLLLAGVSNFRDAAEKPATEDGILTAYEASLLDLQGTELVVLSACETGLGQVQAGEGVYGLQRGFAVAGARAILMSLWKVDDAVTRELMTSFYRNWLGGKNKRTALLAAQQQVRQQHPDPYYWGAFILVGE